MRSGRRGIAWWWRRWRRRISRRERWGRVFAIAVGEVRGSAVAVWGTAVAVWGTAVVVRRTAVVVGGRCSSDGGGWTSGKGQVEMNTGGIRYWR